MNLNINGKNHKSDFNFWEKLKTDNYLAENKRFKLSYSLQEIKDKKNKLKENNNKLKLEYDKLNQALISLRNSLSSKIDSFKYIIPNKDLENLSIAKIYYVLLEDIATELKDKQEEDYNVDEYLNSSIILEEFCETYNDFNKKAEEIQSLMKKMVSDLEAVKEKISSFKNEE